MKTILLVQGIVILIGIILLSFLGVDAKQNGLSYLYGSAIVLVNLAVLWWTWSRILQKKLVALAVLIIVSKYAILGALIYRILTLPNVSQLWFSVGLSTILVTVLVFGLIHTLGAKWHSTSPH